MTGRTRLREKEREGVLIDVKLGIYLQMQSA